MAVWGALSMDDLLRAADDLAAIVDEVTQRVQLRRLKVIEHGHDFNNDLPDFSFPAGASPSDIYAIVVGHPLIILNQTLSDACKVSVLQCFHCAVLNWSERADRTLEEARVELQAQRSSEIVALKVLMTNVRLARDCRAALAAHLEAVEAVAILGRDPQLKRSVSHREEDSAPDETYRAISELDAGILAATRRAVDTNGFVQRPAETLIRAMDTLIPWSEGMDAAEAKSVATNLSVPVGDPAKKSDAEKEIAGFRSLLPWSGSASPTQNKCLVPDPAIIELALATEVVARDFVGLLMDHVEACWETEIRPRLPTLQEHPDDLSTELRARFPLEALRASIQKSCDDLERRLKRGGIAAYVGPPIPRLSPLELVKTAIRYPMQLAALAFLALPLLAVLGWAQESSSPGAILKEAAGVLFPVLAVFAFWQAFVACRTAKAAALDDARRHLRSETSKSLKEVGDAVTKEVSAFLKKEGDRLKADVFAKEQARRDAEQQKREIRRDAMRAASATRLKALTGLSQQLEKEIKGAEETIRKTTKELQKALASPLRKAGRKKDELEKAE